MGRTKKYFFIFEFITDKYLLLRINKKVFCRHKGEVICKM